MTDQMDNLKSAMDAAPAPDGKAAAMDAAMRAFDDEFQHAPQESPAPARRTVQMQLIWSRMMTALNQNLRPALMGGASVAALSLAVFVSFDRSAPVVDLGDFAQERVETAPQDAGAAIEEADATTHARMRMDDEAGPPPETIGAAKIGASNAETATQLPAVPPAAAATAAPATVGHAGTAKRREADFATSPSITAGAAPEITPEIAAPAPDSRDSFANADANPVKLVAEAPVSTFSIDVDTASYAWIRRSLREGRLPDPASVRIEEMVNYFAYDYPAASSSERPFSVATTVMDAPWAEGRKLLRIGLRGFEPETPKRANYTFLIDTSGSMNAPDKLPLLLTSFRLMLDSLRPDDTVAIVTYAGSSTIALAPTSASQRGAILDALDRLQAGGGTAGAAGIETAYRLAGDRFDAEAVNRVILATDGDFNIGAASVDAMKTLIGRQRDSGVFLSVLGFGRGNLNDALMQSLAQAGNGQAAYIDTLAEARKALVEERRAMTPIAADVKIQIEFNPAAARDYRLIGYETRALARQDFNNDRVDAGEIGAGHRVTAIYEFTPVGGPARIDPLRYQSMTAADGDASEIAHLRLRWKQPGGATSELIEVAIPSDDTAPNDEARFASAVAGFGEALRGSPHLGDWSYDDALTLAKDAKGEDPFGYRAEFLDLVRLARSLDR